MGEVDESGGCATKRVVGSGDGVNARTAEAQGIGLMIGCPEL
jgi:hypothetical protein